MKNKETYRNFCQKEAGLPIFSKDWWLDSVCGEDGWDVVLVKNGGKIVATMAYCKTKKSIFNGTTTPKLTQALGPYIKYPQGQNYYKKLSWQKETMTSLIEQLPEFDFFSQKFHYSVENWLPFYWRGYKQTTKYTYLIKKLLVKSNEDIFNSFTPNYRNKIRKAEKIVSVKNNLDINRFYEINRKTFLRQKKDIPYSLNFLRKHDNAISTNKAREIFYAQDEEGKIHSALYLTWDANSSYVHMVGEDPMFRNSGAGILLVWESIKFTKNNLKIDFYDFEGSMIENVEQVRRSFGAIQTPYFAITKTNSKLIKLFNCIKS